MIRFLFASLFFVGVVQASEVDSAIEFFAWLEQHAKEFAACDVEKSGGDYILCDRTRVSQAEIKKMFGMRAPELIAALKNKGIKVELVCASSGEAVLGTACAKESSNKMFSEVTALHGKYIPEAKTILIRNSASLGSLIHEYIHYLQSENTNPVFGHVYKRERNEIQSGLVRVMDRNILEIQALEKAGSKAGIQPKLEEFKIAMNALRGFMPWQDLIDERGIFRLYLKFGDEFGAASEDKMLAQKNMGFVCKNPKLAKLFPESQCGEASLGVDWRIQKDTKAIDAVIALANKSPEAQLKTIRSGGVCVKLLESGRAAPKGFFVWESVEKPKGKLSDVTKHKALMGKTLCKGEHRIASSCETVVLAGDAPRVTLLHEYLHVKQIAKDQSWCELSKRLWKEKPSVSDEREMLDREWDVLAALWTNREDLRLDVQDRLTVAGEISELAPQRKYDSSAEDFVRAEKVKEGLLEAVAEYKKALKH